MAALILSALHCLFFLHVMVDSESAEMVHMSPLDNTLNKKKCSVKLLEEEHAVLENFEFVCEKPLKLEQKGLAT